MNTFEVARFLGGLVPTFLVCALISYLSMGEDVEKWGSALVIYGVWTLIWGGWFFWRGKRVLGA